MSITFLRVAELKWLKEEGALIEGSVLNVGSGPDRWNYKQYFTKAERYRNLDVLGWRNVDLVADVRDIPLPSDSEDCILAAFMLYHILDVRDALREFRRVLRRGGILLVTYEPLPPPFYLRKKSGFREVRDGGTWKMDGRNLSGNEVLGVLGNFFRVDEVREHKENGCGYLFIRAVALEEGLESADPARAQLK